MSPTSNSSNRSTRQSCSILVLQVKCFALYHRNAGSFRRFGAMRIGTSPGQLRATAIGTLASVIVIAVAVGFSSGVAQMQVANRDGTLAIPQRNEPKSFNLVFTVDAQSRTIIGLTTDGLILINCQTPPTEPAVATSRQVSRDDRRCTFAVRPDVRFSDGPAFDGDESRFIFQIRLDEKNGLHALERG